jgi:hypothetical protein
MEINTTNNNYILEKNKKHIEKRTQQIFECLTDFPNVLCEMISDFAQNEMDYVFLADFDKFWRKRESGVDDFSCLICLTGTPRYVSCHLHGLWSCAWLGFHL